MANDKDRESILLAVKERVKQSEEQQLTQMVADAIGERRYRDLKDIVSQIEQDRGWPETLKHLSKARKFTYTLPIGAGPSKTVIENLKYRETIFSILDCCGFEPITVTIEEILSRLKDEDSLIDASRLFQTECESLAIKQIETGDTLFFDRMYFDSSTSKAVIDLLEESQHQEINNLLLDKHDDRINILPLWYCERGRQALSQLGIKGTTIDSETFDIVISVIHEDISITESLEPGNAQQPLIQPSNLQYRTLITSIINHDIESLCSMSSKHSYHTLKSKLEEALDSYEKHSSSANFRNVLSYMNAHVRVRTTESIMSLEELTHSKDTRIATTAITALGNFYNESAASALVDLLCETKNREVEDTTIRGIKNVSKRCFETKYILKSALDSVTCTNIARIKRIYKELWKENDDYYL
ncbi:MAG: HEAT repeat domain-containing protein [Candidatus Thorarchaeota archaeon]